MALIEGFRVRNYRALRDITLDAYLLNSRVIR